MMTVWSSTGYPQSSTSPRCQISGSSGLYCQLGILNQLFCSHHAYTSYTMSFTVACNRSGQGWDSDSIAKDIAELEYILLQCLRLLTPLRDRIQKH